MQPTIKYKSQNTCIIILYNKFILEQTIKEKLIIISTFISYLIHYM